MMVRCDHCGQDKEVTCDDKYREGYNAGYLEATQKVLTIIYGTHDAPNKDSFTQMFYSVFNKLKKVR